MKKLLLMAAAVATLFASCAKENDGNENLVGNGEKAKVGFSFKLPKGGFTRADGDPQDAINPDEIAVNRVTVFIFDASGVPATLNPFVQFNDVAAAFPGSTDLEYELDEEYFIETNSGKAHIYVGVNLPASLNVPYATESLLLAAKANANGENQTAEGFAVAEDFTLFGQAKDPVTKLPEVDLAEYDATSDNVQEVTVEVSRVVSKVVATYMEERFSATQYQSTTPAVWENGVLLKYDIVSYNVYQELTESYLGYRAGQSVWTSLYDQYQSFFKNAAGVETMVGNPQGNGGNHPVLEFAQAIGPHNDLTDLNNGFYIGENYSNKNPNFNVNPVNDLSRNGAATYAMVAAKVRVNKLAKVNPASTEDFKVEWLAVNNSALGLGTTDGYTSDDDLDLYIFKAIRAEDNKPEIYITVEADTAAVRNALNTRLQATAVPNPDFNSGLPVGPGNAEYIYPAYYRTVSAQAYEYTDSYVHFLVWLNRDGFNDYNIGRNQFVHVHVTGVAGMDAAGNIIFPGYPGDPNDPEKPIDIYEDDNNPDPKDEEEEIEGAPSLLKVVITIKDWVYRFNGGQLSR